MSKQTPRLVGVGVLAAIVILAVGLLLRPQPVGVDLAPVVRGDLLVTVQDEGETRVKDIYVVSAPVAGRVLRIDIEVGDAIRAGETILATFEPTDPAILDVRSRSSAESEVKAAEAATQLAVAERDRAGAELAFAEAELQRKRPLAERGTLSASDLQRAQLDVDRARAALAAARANVRVKRSQLDMARAVLITATDAPGGTGAGGGEANVIPVRAPIDGRVLRLIQESEAVVAAGTPILEAGDEAMLEIVVDLLSSDAVRVEPGDRVIIEEWGGDTALDGIVRRVEPFGFTKVSALGIEEQRVNVVIDITSPNAQWRQLGHGYRVEARIVIEQRRDVLKIPVSTLFRSSGEWSVFVNDGGAAQLQTLTLGKRNTLEAEVVEGLEEGMLVITHPSDRIEEGIAIEPRPVR